MLEVVCRKFAPKEDARHMPIAFFKKTSCLMKQSLAEEKLRGGGEKDIEKGRGRGRGRGKTGGGGEGGGGAGGGCCSSSNSNRDVEGRRGSHTRIALPRSHPGGCLHKAAAAAARCFFAARRRRIVASSAAPVLLVTLTLPVARALPNGTPPTPLNRYIVDIRRLTSSSSHRRRHYQLPHTHTHTQACIQPAFPIHNKVAQTA